MDTDAEENSGEADDQVDNEIECPNCFNPHARGVMLRRSIELEDGPVTARADLPNPTIICNKCGKRTEIIPSGHADKIIDGMIAKLKSSAAEHQAKAYAARAAFMHSAKIFRWNTVLLVFVSMALSAIYGMDFYRWIKAHTFMTNKVGVGLHVLMTWWFLFIINKNISIFTGESKYRKEKRAAKREAKAAKAVENQTPKSEG